MRIMNMGATEVYENNNNVYVLDHSLMEIDVYRDGSPYPTEHLSLDSANWGALVDYLQRTADLTW